MFWKQDKTLERVATFLRRSGLENRSFDLEALIKGARRAGYDVLAKPGREVGNLKGLVVRYGGVTMIRYPASNDTVAFQTVCHELAHVILGHKLRRLDEAVENSFFNDEQEAEAEEFADQLLAHAGMVHMRNEAESDYGPELSEFLTSLGPEGQ